MGDEQVEFGLRDGELAYNFAVGGLAPVRDNSRSDVKRYVSVDSGRATFHMVDGSAELRFVHLYGYVMSKDGSRRTQRKGQVSYSGPLSGYFVGEDGKLLPADVRGFGPPKKLVEFIEFLEHRLTLPTQITETEWTLA